MFIPVSMGYYAILFIDSIIPFFPKVNPVSNIILFTLLFFSVSFFLTFFFLPMLVKNKEATVQEGQVVSVTRGKKKAVKIENIRNLSYEKYSLNIECSDGSNYKFWHPEPKRLSDEILVNKI